MHEGETMVVMMVKGRRSSVVCSLNQKEFVLIAKQNMNKSGEVVEVGQGGR